MLPDTCYNMLLLKIEFFAITTHYATFFDAEQKMVLQIIVVTPYLKKKSERPQCFRINQSTADLEMVKAINLQG